MSGATDRIGVVVIGRNEGERLRRCLASVVRPGLPVVYVDSGSTDGSAAAARALGADCVELDPARPFSAARGRAAGLERLVETAPHAEFVFFVDGDCEVNGGFLDAAAAHLGAHPRVAVVFGRRRERFPERSVYNLLCDLEWDGKPGEVKACGGDSVMRIAAVRAAGSFDPSVVAGEEPELCMRLRAAGFSVERLACEMTLHDAAMTEFSQWWRRCVRSGYGAMDVGTRLRERGVTKDVPFAHLTRSARIWALGWPLVTLAVAGAGWALLGPAGALLGLLPLALGPLQALRIASKRRAAGATGREALVYGVFTMIAKFAQFAGQRRSVRERRRGASARIIEYKPAPGAQGPAAHSS